MPRLLIVIVSLLYCSCTPQPRGGAGQVGDLPQELGTSDSPDNEINELADEQSASGGGTDGSETETSNNDLSAVDSTSAGEVNSQETDSGSTSTPAVIKAHVRLSSGGGALTSPGYRLKLFVAPASPVGRTHSTSYQLLLGPASTFIPLQEIP